MYKLITFCPKNAVDSLIQAMGDAGAGIVGNYSHCAFVTEGQGNWFSGANTNPTIGKAGTMSKEPECRIEMLCKKENLQLVIKAINKTHPYEEPEIDIIKLEDLQDIK